MLSVDDALTHMVAILQRPKGSLSKYGYDLYLPDIIWQYLTNRGPIADVDKARQEQIELSPPFYVAAWELCRRGVLRPGVSKHGKQVTDDGSGGNGYCLTPFGKNWLDEASGESIAALIPGRFADMLHPHEKRFGHGYLLRGTEAVRCYNAHAYFACCAMCGAAAESILLALASEMEKPDEVVSMYGRSGGRAKVENLLVGRQTEPVRREFRGFMVLLNYWRDEAAHGIAVNISETEAFTSLMLLLRLARFADETF